MGFVIKIISNLNLDKYLRLMVIIYFAFRLESILNENDWEIFERGNYAKLILACAMKYWK